MTSTIAADSNGPVWSRRSVLIGAGTATAAGVLAGPGRGLVDLLRWWGDDRATLHRSSMAGELGHRLELHRPDGTTVELELLSIDGLPQTVITDAEGQFAARFAAPAGTRLLQDSYTLTSGRFGEIVLFLSPLDDADGRERYEALFNRPAELRGVAP